MYDYFNRTVEEIEAQLVVKKSQFGRLKGMCIRNAHDWEAKAVKSRCSHIESLSFVDEFEGIDLVARYEEGEYCEYALDGLKKLLRLQENICKDTVSIRKHKKAGE